MFPIVHYKRTVGEERGREVALDERRDDSAGRRRLRAHPRRLRGDALYPRGRVRQEYGDGLKQVVENTAGDFHLHRARHPAPRSSTSAPPIPVVAVVARSDASEWSNIIPYQKS